jgi:GNAT superfamily N-acetyltransferase
MNNEEILSRLDFERQTVPDPDAKLERAQNVVRAIAKVGNRNAIVYSNFSARDANKIIDAELDYFTKLQLRFEWKVYSHDEPSDLLERLGRRGFKIGTEEALMMLDLYDLPPALSAPPSEGIVVRPVVDEQAIEDFVNLESAIWSESLTTRAFLRFNQSDPLSRELAFVAYSTGKPIGMARVTASSESQFAGLWGGSVLNEFRGRGVYRALLSARIQRAREYDSTRYLRVDALPTSRPILEKYGFNRVGSTWPAVWPS